MPINYRKQLIEARHARLLEVVNEIGSENTTRSLAADAILVEGPSIKNPRA